MIDADLWHDLGDDELAARLRQRDVPEHDVVYLVRHRDEPEARAYIADVQEDDDAR